MGEAYRRVTRDAHRIIAKQFIFSNVVWHIFIVVICALGQSQIPVQRFQVAELKRFSP